MHISPTKTPLHEWVREEAGVGACGGPAVREDPVTYINQLRGERGDREEEVGEKKAEVKKTNKCWLCYMGLVSSRVSAWVMASEGLRDAVFMRGMSEC